MDVQRLAIIKYLLLLIVVANILSLAITAVIGFGQYDEKCKGLTDGHCDAQVQFYAVVYGAIAVHVVSLIGIVKENLIMVTMFAISITVLTIVNMLNIPFRAMSLYLGSVFFTLTISALAISMSVIIWYKSWYQSYYKKKHMTDKGIATDSGMVEKSSFELQVDLVDKYIDDEDKK